MGEVKKHGVYVAGALNADACGYIKNAHRMIKTARMLRKAGFSVYVPANDFLEGLVAGDFEYEDYFQNSKYWLEHSEAMYLTPGWESSKGTQREIDNAKAHNIPVFDNLYEIQRYFNGDL